MSVIRRGDPRGTGSKGNRPPNRRLRVTNSRAPRQGDGQTSANTSTARTRHLSRISVQNARTVSNSSIGGCGTPALGSPLQANHPWRPWNSCSLVSPMQTVWLQHNVSTRRILEVIAWDLAEKSAPVVAGLGGGAIWRCFACALRRSRPQARDDSGTVRRLLVGATLRCITARGATCGDAAGLLELVPAVAHVAVRAHRKPPHDP
jgi:hypothetical protein